MYDGYSVVTYVPQEKWKENCYLLIVGNTCFLIDPGFGCEGIISYIKEHGYNLKEIIVTHAHHDHIASVQAISEAFSVACIIHPDDKRLFMHAPMYSIRFAKRPLVRPKNVEWLTNNVASRLREDGLGIMHTPGHSQGGICVFFKQILFTGDTVVQGYLGRTDLPEGNRLQIIESAKKIFTQAVDKKVQFIYPGHGDMWTMKEALNWWQDGRQRYEEKKTF